jgi:HPt (histidine-containing phosphotransfer) domain-containing protein
VSENDMTSTLHLSPEVIQELRLIMGDEFGTLLQTFIADSRQRLTAIDEALQTADADMLRRAAHSFKGSTGNMGAARMSELCRQLEDMGRLGSVVGGADLLAQLRAEFALVQREVDSLAH